jgi:3-hydroxyacyl-[acyl-carrier-protein] dehydratase
MELKFPLGVVEIEKIIPHRYPFLFVDKVVDFSDRQYIVGQKNVSANESYFAGHFPNHPLMPGVIIVEALAQLGAIFAKLSTNGSAKDKLMVFAGADALKFRRQVNPGDVLELRQELIKQRMSLWKTKGTATVNGEIAVEGIFTAAEV